MSQLVRLVSPIDAAAAFRLGADLQALVDALRSSGHRVHPQSRLPAAVTLLRRVATAPMEPMSPADGVRLAFAINLAASLSAPLAHALREGITPEWNSQIKLMLDGALDDTGGTPALQAQSEIYEGMVLRHGGLDPQIVPRGEQKSPDFVADVAGLDVAIEVKRPSGLGSIRRALRDGVDQCDTVGVRHGAIILDLSDCIRPPVCEPDEGGEPAALVMAELQPGFRVASKCFGELSNTEAGCGMIALIVTARIVVFAPSGRLPANQVFAVATMSRDGPVRGIVLNQPDQFVRQYAAGISALGGVVTEAGRLQPPK